MRLTLIAVGSRMPQWVQDAYQEYAKRLPRDFSLNLVEIPMSKRGKSIDLERAIKKEGELMLAAVPNGDHVVTLEVEGKPWSTGDLARQAGQWRMDASNVSLLVGGPDGLAPACLQRSQQRWSLSALTLPHPLVRVIVAEQLYRAWSILHNHPYHR
jgi:23S rRNA (pseudouridine1915-N3)-methyltransferase